MAYAEFILGLHIDWLTMPRTNVDLRATRQSRVVPSSMLGQNVGRPIPLARQPPMIPSMIQAYFDFLPITCHQPLGSPPSNRVDLNDANEVLGVPIEPLAM